ncbi:terminase gpA endonuclease subunit [Planctomycetota bacterium]
MGRSPTYLPKEQAERRRVSKSLHEQKVRAAGKTLTTDYSRQNLRRRNYYKNRPAAFCRKYFPKVFYNDFVTDQRALVTDFKNIIKYGGLLARADTRGAGKSSVGKCVGGVWAIVYGHIKWLVLVEVNTEEATETLEDILSYYTDDTLSDDDLFGADFPELCQAMRYAKRNPQPARRMVIDSQETSVVVKKDKLVFPKLKGVAASGARIIPKGAEKPIRGMAKLDVRPDLVWINDVETDETARSPAMTRNIRKNITQAIMGLEGPNAPLGVLMTGTIIERECLLSQYTDRTKHPEWHGKRCKFFIEWPASTELMDKYLYLKSQDEAEANSFFSDNQVEIEAGAVISNPHRYISQKGPDGRPLEISAIQHAYNKIFIMKMPAFMCEWQNDPQQEDIEMKLECNEVQKKINGVPRGIVPEGVVKIAAAVDVHSRRLNWTVTGYTDKGAGKVIDYDVSRVHSPQTKLSDQDPALQQAVEAAVFDALMELKGIFGVGWPDQDGAVRNLDLGLIDAGYKSGAVYEFCRIAGGLFRPIKGFGGESGQAKYRRPARGSKTIRLGNYWFATIVTHKGRGLWVYHLDADHWKRAAQEGFMLDEDKAGSLILYGSEPYVHSDFARQITAEEWITEAPTGKPISSRWLRHQKDNHFLDDMGLAMAAADMLGLGGLSAPAPKQAPRRRRIGQVQRLGSNYIRTSY